MGLFEWFLLVCNMVVIIVKISFSYILIGCTSNVNIHAGGCFLDQP